MTKEKLNTIFKKIVNTTVLLTNNLLILRHLKTIISRFRYTYQNISLCNKINVKGVDFAYPINTIIGNKDNFTIGEGTRFGKYTVLTAWNAYRDKRYNPKVSIGKNCYFGDYLHLTCIENIKIGDNVLTGRWVTITDNGHGKTEIEDLYIAPEYREIYVKGPTIIGDNVWIGDKATILPGLTIGDGCVIGANSVVSKDIPQYCIVAGNPAKIIKRLKA